MDKYSLKSGTAIKLDIPTENGQPPYFKRTTGYILDVVDPNTFATQDCEYIVDIGGNKTVNLVATHIREVVGKKRKGKFFKSVRALEEI